MAAWPQIKAALAAGVQALPEFADATVFVGIPVTGDYPRKYMTVGSVNDENNAGTYSRAQVYDGSVWQEIGEVRSTIASWAGDADPRIAESAAFGMADAVDAWVSADRTVGGALSPDSEVHIAVDVLSTSNSAGTATELVLVLTYTTTTE